MRRLSLLAALVCVLALSLGSAAHASDGALYSYFCDGTGAELNIVGATGQSYVVRNSSGVVLAYGVAGSDDWWVALPSGEFAGVWVTSGSQSTWVLNTERDAHWE